MKHLCKRVALGVSLALPLATALPLAASPVAPVQDHHDNDDHDTARYTSNTFYQTGNREGYEDYQKKERRKKHHHHYKTHDDRRAHDAGYEQGWQGQPYNNNGYHPQ